MYILYDRKTGEIKNKVSCSLTSIKLDVSSKINYTVCNADLDIDRYYYSKNKIILKPSMQLQYNTTILKCNENTIISNIPKGTQIIINNKDYGICDDGKIILDFDTLDIYTVLLINFPYKQEILQYHVN